MYQVDKKEVFSVEFCEKKVNTYYKYLEEVKTFFGKVKFKDGYYLDGNYKYDFSNEEVYNKPFVTIKFRELGRGYEYFEFNTDKEAIEFFNLITTPDKTLTK